MGWGARMKRKAKKNNPVLGCLLLVGIAIAAIGSLFSKGDRAPTPDTQIVRNLAPAVNTSALLPTVTAELAPTVTPVPTEPPTVAPTDTPAVLPTDTPVPVPTEPPAAVVENSGGSDQPFVCAGGCTEPPAGSDCQIKGNVNSKGDLIYHMPGWRDYERTDIKPEEGDRWFCTEEEAAAAGFRAPLNH